MRVDVRYMCMYVYAYSYVYVRVRTRVLDGMHAILHHDATRPVVPSCISTVSARRGRVPCMRACTDADVEIYGCKARAWDGVCMSVCVCL